MEQLVPDPIDKVTELILAQTKLILADMARFQLEFDRIHHPDLVDIVPDENCGKEID